MNNPDEIQYMTPICGNMFIIPMPIGSIECLRGSRFDEATRHSRLFATWNKIFYNETGTWETFVCLLHDLRNRCAWNIQHLYSIIQYEVTDVAKYTEIFNTLVDVLFQYMAHVKMLLLLRLRYGDNISTELQFVSYWANPVYNYSKWTYVIVDTMKGEFQMCALTLSLLFYMKAVLMSSSESTEFFRLAIRTSCMGIANGSNAYLNEYHMTETVVSNFCRIVMLMASVSVVRLGVEDLSKTGEILSNACVSVETWSNMKHSQENITGLVGDPVKYIDYHATLFNLYTSIMEFIQQTVPQIKCVEVLAGLIYDEWSRFMIVYIRYHMNQLMLSNDSVTGTTMTTVLCPYNVDNRAMYEYKIPYTLSRFVFRAMCVHLSILIDNTADGSTDKVKLLERLKTDAQHVDKIADYLKTYYVSNTEKIKMPVGIKVSLTSKSTATTSSMITKCMLPTCSKDIVAFITDIVCTHNGNMHQ